MYPPGMGNYFPAYDSATIELVKESVLAGYKVFQIKWDSSWLIGSEKREGFAKMAVHPATVAKELIKRFGIGDKPVILFGGSGGAAQIAYVLSYYGLDNEVDAAILWGGFWMGRIDIGCLDTNPLNAHLHYSEIAQKWMDPKKFIDLSYGYDHDTPGPCELGDTSFRKSFLENSIAGNGNYFFPNTKIYLLYAGNDGLGALNQGLTYYEKLISAGSPNVYMQVVDGAKHEMTKDSTSLSIFKTILLQSIE
jgi:pimeloyl-ACP methyl ester carboxylesterase